LTRRLIPHALVEKLAVRGHKTIVESKWENLTFGRREVGGQSGGEKMTQTRKVIIDGVEYEVEIEQDGDIFHATVEGKTFEIQVPESKQSAPRKRGGGSRARSGIVSASMPGKVVTVEVTKGQQVTEGQTVLILEAMKMQNEVVAPISGTVAEVSCSEGDNVEANVPLVVIEALSE